MSALGCGGLVGTAAQVGVVAIVAPIGRKDQKR
jgi:hypothetical protein